MSIKDAEESTWRIIDDNFVYYTVCYTTKKENSMLLTMYSASKVPLTVLHLGSESQVLVFCIGIFFNWSASCRMLRRLSLRVPARWRSTACCETSKAYSASCGLLSLLSSCGCTTSAWTTTKARRGSILATKGSLNRRGLGSTKAGVWSSEASGSGTTKWSNWLYWRSVSGSCTTKANGTPSETVSGAFRLSGSCTWVASPPVNLSLKHWARRRWTCGLARRALGGTFSSSASCCSLASVVVLIWTLHFENCLFKL